MKTNEGTNYDENQLSTDESFKRTICLNESTVLVLSEDNETKDIGVSVRYYEGNKRRCDRIATITDTTFIKYNSKLVAIFKHRKMRKPQLISVYDAIRHDFYSQEMMKLEYNATSYENEIPVQLTKAKK